jgi:transposase
MRGGDKRSDGMWSTLRPADRVPEDHPLRPIRAITNEVLKELSPQFSKLYSKWGRPSIPPEKLLRALLLQAFYTIRSERQLMEQLAYNLLFRWFVGLGMDDPVWNPTTFTKNRDRLLNGEVAWRFFQAVVDQARSNGLLSEEHFTVDGTLIDAWASHKSFVPKGGNGPKTGDGSRNADVDFRGQKRSNETHQSITDPESRLFRKSHGTESKLCYAAHVLMDNRHGLAVEGCVTMATSSAEREAALWMTERLPRRATLGADKGYDVRSFAEKLRRRGITPHLAAKNASYSTIDGRTTRHEGYAISQRKRKLVEQIFGWTKTVAVLRKTRHRGRERVDWMFVFALAAYNLIRIRNLTWSSA